MRLNKDGQEPFEPEPGSDLPKKDATGQQLEAARLELERARSKLRSLQGELAQVRGELETVRGELEISREKQRSGDATFQKFSESGILGIALFELAGTVVYANDALLSMTGCSRDDMDARRMNLVELVPTDLRDTTTAAMEDLAALGSCGPYEQEFLRPDGSRIWTLFTGIMLGQQAVAFVLDITGRRAADEALRFQSRLLDAVEQAVIASDTDGVITYWSRFAQQLYGWKSDEVMDRNITDVIPTDSSPVSAEASMARLRRGESWSGERTVRRRDGAALTIAVTASPLYDGEGQLTGIVALSSDVTARRATEQALRASENRFRTMFDQSPLSMQVFAPDGTHRAVNPAWEKLWGASPHEVTRYNILNDERVRAMGSLPYIERAFRGEPVTVPPSRIDLAEIGRTGTPLWIEAYLYPVKDESGALREVVLISEDVTERLQIEQERSRLLGREQQARARAEETQFRMGFLAEASRILSSSLDYQTTFERVANLVVPILADWCDIQVLDEAGAIRRVAIAHIDPDKVALADELNRRYPMDPEALTGVPQVLRTGIPEIYREIPDELLVAGTRDEEHLRISRALKLRSALVMPLNARGRTLGAMSLFYAESDRRYSDDDIALAEDLARRAGTAIDNARLYSEAQSAIRRHQVLEQKLTLLTEATGTLIGSLDLDQVLEAVLSLSHQLVEADAYAVWLCDRQSESWQIASARGLSDRYRTRVVEVLSDFRGDMPGPLVIEDVEKEPLLEQHRQSVREEGIRSMMAMPLRLHTEPGGTLVFYYREAHVFDDVELKVSGALANLASSAISTTELYGAVRQRADQLAEADRLKDQFLAMLAHELRNPLGAIGNAIQVMGAAPTGTDVFERARSVVGRQSQHMARLVDELLDVSRISRGKIEIHPEPMDLGALLIDTWEDHRRLLEAGELDLTIKVPEPPIWVHGDPTRLRQTVGNLLQNAAKFTHSGGRVTLEATVDPQNQVARVTVSDSGIGISQDLLTRLFEPFVQGDNSLARTQGGLGLGLALVKGIVELHAGAVHIQSGGAGRGTSVSFSIPLLVGAEHLPATDRHRQNRTGHSPIEPGNRKVLIIEDNQDAAESMRDLLELSGHQVQIAHSGPEGVDLARQDPPDVVLCDLGLPGMDGFEVAVTLRRDRSTAVCRLIAISGYGQEQDQQRSRASGFDLHLTKPLNPGELEEVIGDTKRETR